MASLWAARARQNADVAGTVERAGELLPGIDSGPKAELSEVLCQMLLEVVEGLRVGPCGLGGEGGQD